MCFFSSLLIELGLQNGVSLVQYNAARHTKQHHNGTLSARWEEATIKKKESTTLGHEPSNAANEYEKDKRKGQKTSM
jgi:hypothetical protein